MAVTARYGQTLLDITIQELGDAERLHEIAELNGLDITTDLEAGQSIEVPAIAFDKKSIAAIFTDKNKPASALNTSAFIVDEWEAYYDNGEDDWDVYFGYTG